MITNILTEEKANRGKYLELIQTKVNNNNNVYFTRIKPPTV